MAASDDVKRTEGGLDINAIAHTSEPLTTKEFFALDVDEKLKVELIGGALLVSPSAKAWHNRVANYLFRLLEDTLGPGFLVFTDIDVILDEEYVPRPDVFVVRSAGCDVDAVAKAADVLVALEVVSPGSKVADRQVKPAAYRDAGIPTWRIERDGKRLYLVETPLHGMERTHVGTTTMKVADIEVVVDLDAVARHVFGD